MTSLLPVLHRATKPWHLAVSATTILSYSVSAHLPPFCSFDLAYILASEPLHMLISLPGTLFLKYPQWWLPHFLQGSAHEAFPNHLI